MAGKQRIYRGPRPQSNYYILDKRISEDDRLSWEARGVFIYLLGKPDDWNICLNHLVKIGSAGRDKMYKIMNELIECGYCVRTRDENGRGAKYVISETPLTEKAEAVDKEPLPENQDADDKEPLPENQYAGNPLPENPRPENPFPENPTLLITEYNQELTSTNKKTKSKKSDQPEKTQILFDYDAKQFVGIEDFLEQAAVAYPHVNQGQQLAKAGLWLIERRYTKQGQKKDLGKFLRNWFEKEEQKSETKAASGVMRPDWQCCSEMVEYVINQNVPRQFVEWEHLKFRMYWVERGEPRQNWDNKFAQWCIDQWSNPSYREEFFESVEHIDTEVA